MNPTTEYEPPVTPSETARRLGVSKQTVMRMIKCGDIAVVPVGRRYRVPAAELRRILTPVKLGA